MINPRWRKGFPSIEDFYFRRTTSGNVKINSYISSIGGKAPNTREYYEGSGTYTGVAERIFTSSTSHEATKPYHRPCRET
jgi:hypothetical protein